MIHHQRYKKRGLKALWVVGCGVWVACHLLGVSVYGVEAEELKIGYVNVAKVFDNYQRTKASDAVLKQKGQQKEAELKTRVQEIQKLRDNLEILSPEAREGKTREIEEKADELERFRNRTARDLSQERDGVAKEILDDIQKAIDNYAKANGFSVVLDQRALLYVQPTHDVTDKILGLLNKSATAKR